MLSLIEVDLVPFTYSIYSSGISLPSIYFCSTVNLFVSILPWFNKHLRNLDQYLAHNVMQFCLEIVLTDMCCINTLFETYCYFYITIQDLDVSIQRYHGEFFSLASKVSYVFVGDWSVLNNVQCCSTPGLRST